MDFSKLAGGCACGAVRYACSAPPVFTLNCHCKDCQRTSGAAFASGFIVANAALDVRGEVHWFETRGETGATAVRGFCPTCGSQLFAQQKGAEFRSVRSASLDDASWFKPSANIFVRSAQPWVVLDAGIPSFEAGPPM